jgi:hypothetical protein
MSRKLTAVVFLVLALLPFVTVIAFHVQQKIIRHQMKEALEEGAVVSIILGRDEFTWMRKEREILVDGNLFDVKTYSVDKGLYHFTGLYDHQEKKLLENLKQDPGVKHIQDLLNQLFQLLQAGFEKSSLELTSSGFHNIIQYSDCSELLSPGFISLMTPPPQS